MTEGQCQAATNMKNVRKALRARVGVKKTGAKRPTVLDKEPAHQRKQINNTKTIAGRPSKLPQRKRTMASSADVLRYDSGSDLQTESPSTPK
ncbi:unnamed protein product, partial [Didymodactylos carnosus]